MMQQAQYTTDSKSQPPFAVIPAREHHGLWDQLSDVQLYDEAKRVREPSLPMEEAFRLIEARHCELPNLHRQEGYKSVGGAQIFRLR